ncbi:MAG: MerR family transcriptional regulator [Candidatus Falkowbacteria bacterium]|nr:MerR family transcriptional regulator [Candidatus Falkowbacteria bacterium]
MEKQVKKKSNLIEMAKKRRHIALVEKLATGKPSTPSLSRSEIKELQSFELPTGSPAVVDTQEEVAKILGVTVRTVQYWTRDGMPVTPQGTYDLIEIRAWRLLKNKKYKKLNDKSKKPDWEEKYREMKARLAGLDYKKAVGELIYIADARSIIIANIVVAKQNLLAIPTRVSPQLVGLNAREIFELLTEKIKEAIRQLSASEIYVCGERKLNIIVKSIKYENESQKTETN